MKRFKRWLLIAAAVVLAMGGQRLTGESQRAQEQQETTGETAEEPMAGAFSDATGMPQAVAQESETTISLAEIPPFTEEPYVVINGNVPYFTEEDLTCEAFERYSELDSLDRCGVAFANVCQELMPTEERGAIGQIRPSGWQIAKYDHIDGNYLYNRCHLIGYQLTGENDSEKNLITGTRYLNVQGMLPFENRIADYVRKTGNHVLYRVTPVFEGDNLVAAGVRMEAESVEDHGESILFHVFVYNNQPGVVIDYATGESVLAEGDPETDQNADPQEVTYILNINSMKFHRPDCQSVADMKEKNKRTFTGSREEAIAQGYSPCGGCKP